MSDPQPSRPQRRIALMNQKGGVGKTTTTVNLGAALARRGLRVLIVDLDPQAHASLHLGHNPSPGPDPDAEVQPGSVYDLLLDPTTEPVYCIHETEPNLDLLPSETDLAAAETEMAVGSDRHRRLSAALDRLRDRYDVVLIDCPPSLGVLTLNGLVAASEVLVPMQAHFLALQGVGKLLETVKLVADRLNPGLHVAGVVLCMHDTQTTHTQEVVADIREFFEGNRDRDVPWRDATVFEPHVRRNIKLAECPSFGQTIFAYAPTAAGASDYEALAASVAASGPWRDLELPRADTTATRETAAPVAELDNPAPDAAATGPEAPEGAEDRESGDHEVHVRRIEDLREPAWHDERREG